MTKQIIQISVIIGTYNRPLLLKKAILSLISQSLDHKYYEIVIVENSESVESKKIIESLKIEYGNHNINYIHENYPGLAHARNAGIKKSKGMYIAFLDDDAYVKEDYLERVYKKISKQGKEVFAIGGQIVPYFQSPKPDWFNDKYETDNKGDKERYLSNNESFSGSNMIWRKEILSKFGGFDENVGMKSNILSVGEETELFRNITKYEKRNNIFRYYPDLKIYHLIPPEKMMVIYRLKRWFINGMYYYYSTKQLGNYHYLVNSMKVLAYFVFSLVVLFPLFIFYRHPQNWIIERIGPFSFITGYLAYGLGYSFKIKKTYG